MFKNEEEFSLPKLEEKVLSFWKTNEIFKKSLSTREKGKPFIFYEGPPTANGKPGIHHMIARAFKDVIPRYKTMVGFFVPRKGGWDTHGLPVELEVEKQLGLKSKKDIESFGISAFNRACRKSVWKYKDEWEKFTERMGFWLDLDNPYITYENSYIESVWHILKHAWKEKLLYQGHKVVQWCTRCGTALSSHEMALGYRTVTDMSVYVKFKLNKGQTIGTWKAPRDTYFLAWTTTPWTLPGNVALAVGESIDYIFVENPNEPKETFIVAKERALALGFKNEGARVIKGKALLGLSYKSLFSISSLVTDTAYKVYAAPFVTTTDGTGIVHTAVMYGEDDYQLGVEINLPQRHTVDERGCFTDDVRGFAGQYVKGDETNTLILDTLQKNNQLFKKEEYTHEYPFCWRCETPLIYYARTSWFIKMSELREKLNKANESIHWVPAHLRDGRFGEWLRGAKDWAISRERYWGTPLPIWSCDRCHTTHVVGSSDELSACFPSSHNTYILVRHGEAESNILNIESGWPEKVKHHLTLKGRVRVEHLAHMLREKKIDFIFSSDITRTKETEEILSDAIKGEQVRFDERLREIVTSTFNKDRDEDYYRKRLFEFLTEIERKHQRKTIMIVSHEYPLWILESTMRGWSKERSIQKRKEKENCFYETGEAREVYYQQLPRDEVGVADFHKPYIDEVKWQCSKCRGTMKRTSEVLDVWFDSGAMPFAQSHYPFETGRKLAFPGDYIAEAVDQTRGWFYTLLAIAIILGKKAPYKNVISLGHVLDARGQKMSKSKGNAVDPWKIMNDYGADAVRWYFFTINPPGEPKKFNEIDILKAFRQSISLAYNSFVFFNTYSHKGGSKANHVISKNILDQWVIARLNETIKRVTEYLDHYAITDAARVIEVFIVDLSRWYVRRSRRRFQKPESETDYCTASQTLYFVLLSLSKLMAPFTPFFSEWLYQSLVSKKDLSVHLEKWPITGKRKAGKLIKHMAIIRELASAGLAKRAEAGIRVRQPLSELRVKSLPIGISKPLLKILADEVNVKKVVVNKKLKESCELDTVITHSLREEGLLREFMRLVQELRQDANLTPYDGITLSVTGSDELLHVLRSKEKVVKKEVRAKRIEYKKINGVLAKRETKIDKQEIWVGIKK